jgi:hypothetical protein
MTRDAKPTSNALLLEAVERALDGDWRAAHRIVQDHDTDALAAWIHAVVHRMEGDLLERHHTERFTAIVDQRLPRWRSHRQELNSTPLAHESWAY